MVFAATKKFREIFASGLLFAAALYVISGLSLLVKSEDDIGLDFSGRAAAFGYLFSYPVLVIAIVAAVALVSGFGEASKNAKSIVLAALGLGAMSALFAVVCWFSGFGASSDGGFAVFGGVLGAGKIVGILLGLAQIAFLGLAVFFTFSVFQTFPKSVRLAPQQWPGQQGYGPPQQGWGPPDPHYGQPQPQQQAWARQPPQQPQHPQQWAQQQQWGQPQQSWGQPAEQQSWGQPAEQQSWGQPVETPPADDPVEDSGDADADETLHDANPAEGEEQPPQQGGWWQQPSQ